LKNST